MSTRFCVIIQKIIIFPVVLVFSLIALSCKQRNTKNVETTSIDESVDTLSIYPTLPDAPLLSTSIAYRSNPIITGRISGWEQRLERMYADTLHRFVKTMEMDDLFLASESPIALYNNVSGQQGPVLLHFHPIRENYTPEDYWESHSIKNHARDVIFAKRFAGIYDCRFGHNDIEHFLNASHPIFIKDTLAFKPIISILDEEKGTVFSPLFECFYREKPFLICAFNVESLCMTDGGKYLWSMIRDYTYSPLFRREMGKCTQKMTYDIWFDTLMPDFKLTE